MQSIWLAGTQAEIAEIVEALSANGFAFTYEDPWEIKSTPFGAGRYSCTLYNFRPPAKSAPQPRPWDAVLGGKR